MANPIEKVPEVQSVCPSNFGTRDTFFIQNERNSSSISHAIEIRNSYVPSKPSLDPIQNSLEQFIHFEPKVNKYSQYKENQIEQKIKEIEELQKQEFLRLQEAYEASKNVTFWGILADVGSTIMSAVSFYYGFSALAAGAGPIGGILIVSGTLTLSNLLFKHANVWDYIADHIAGDNEELKEQIRTYLPAALGLLTAAIGIYGGYTTWNYAAHTGFEQGFLLLQNIANLTAALAGFSGGISQYQLKNVTGDLSSIQSIKELSNLTLQKYMDGLKEFHEKCLQLHTILAEIVKQTSESIQILQQPV